MQPGHNLVAVENVLGDGCELFGVEPNKLAREDARRSNPSLQIAAGHAFSLPYDKGSFGLAFTCGVLIHISPDDLDLAMTEIYEASSRYILAVEYGAEEVTPVLYRGHEQLLWKSDFAEQYQSLFQDLRLIRHGFWGPDDGLDNTHWWLLEKSGHPKDS